MSQSALRRFATEYCSVYRFGEIGAFLRPLKISERKLSASGGEKDAGKNAFDVSLLEFLVCPLSKKPLRYCHYTRLSLYNNLQCSLLHCSSRTSENITIALDVVIPAHFTITSKPMSNFPNKFSVE